MSPIKKRDQNNPNTRLQISKKELKRQDPLKTPIKHQASPTQSTQHKQLTSAVKKKKVTSSIASSAVKIDKENAGFHSSSKGLSRANANRRSHAACLLSPFHQTRLFSKIDQNPLTPAREMIAQYAENGFDKSSV